MDQQRVRRRILYWEEAEERGRLLGNEMELRTGKQNIEEVRRRAEEEGKTFLRSFNNELAGSLRHERKKLRNNLSSKATKLKKRFMVAAHSKILARLEAIARKKALDFCNGYDKMPPDFFRDYQHVGRTHAEIVEFMRCSEADGARKLSLHDLLLHIAEKEGEKEQRKTIESGLGELVTSGQLGPRDREVFLSEQEWGWDSVASPNSQNLLPPAVDQTHEASAALQTGALWIPWTGSDPAGLAQEQPSQACPYQIYFVDPREVTDKDELSFAATTGGYVHVPRSAVSLAIHRIVEVSTPRLAFRSRTRLQGRPPRRKTLLGILRNLPALHENKSVRLAIRRVGNNASATKSNRTLSALVDHGEVAVNEYAEFIGRLETNSAALADIQNVQQTEYEICAKSARAA